MDTQNRWRMTQGHCSVVSTMTYLEAMQKVLDGGHEIAIPISGVSMRPYLSPGMDYVKLCPMKNQVLTPGMVVLFRRESGQYVLHRIIKKSRQNLYLAGDAQCVLEGPVDSSHVIAWVSHVKRHGKWHRLWRRKGLLYGVLWRDCFSVRRWWFSLYRRIHFLCNISTKMRRWVLE